MTPDQEELLRMARESLNASRLLLEGGFPRFAASRAYYTMFYVAQAFLEGEGLAFSKHSAVIAGFGQHFARPGRVPAEFHRYLLEAIDIRHEGDYATRPSISESQAAHQIGRAERFLKLALSLVGPLPETEEQS